MEEIKICSTVERARDNPERIPPKVWKKQRGGPPQLPPSIRREIAEGLSSITIDDFEGQTRAMLATVNSRPSGGDGEDGEYDPEEVEKSWLSPPSSFPVEALLQVYRGFLLAPVCSVGGGVWGQAGVQGLGLSRRLDAGFPFNHGHGCRRSAGGRLLEGLGCPARSEGIPLRVDWYHRDRH